jgi:hypothetical protein
MTLVCTHLRENIEDNDLALFRRVAVTGPGRAKFLSVDFGLLLPVRKGGDPGQESRHKEFDKIFADFQVLPSPRFRDRRLSKLQKNQLLASL